MANCTLPLPESQLHFCPSIAHLGMFQNLVPLPTEVPPSSLDLGSLTSSQDDRHCSASVDGMKLRLYCHRTKLECYTFLWKFPRFDKWLLEHLHPTFPHLSGPGLLAIESQQQDRFKFKIYFPLLASQLVQDMHSNGNTLLRMVRLHTALLPQFSYIWGK